MIVDQHLRLTEDTEAPPRKAGGFDDDCQGTAYPQWIEGARANHLIPVPSTGEPAGGRPARRSVARRVRREAGASRRTGISPHREAGMATAEYAIATLAAVGFAALLVAVLSSSQIKGLLTSLITTALNFG